jgi:hypothetical protein
LRTVAIGNDYGGAPSCEVDWREEMRDLKAYLNFLSENPSITKLMELAEEAIERAILAEDCMERRQVACGEWMNKFDKANSELAALREENDLQQQAMQSLSRKMVALHRTLDDIYPLIAGRVIQLRDAGEEKAMEAWNQAARQIVKVLEGIPEQNTQDLTYQVAALKEAIKQIHRYIHPHNCPRYSQFIDDVCDNVLYSPDPGAKIKAVVEAAWKLVDCETRTYSRNKYVHKLKRALADLEGGAPCE